MKQFTDELNFGLQVMNQKTVCQNASVCGVLLVFVGAPHNLSKVLCECFWPLFCWGVCSQGKLLGWKPTGK